MILLQQSTHRMVLRHDPDLGFLFVPNLTARIPNEDGGYYVRTNSAGFRADMEFRPERSDKPRILFFGDSFTAGDGVGNEERFPELVGRILGAEVYNYGLPGSGTDQQLLVFEKLARGVAADLIVLGVFVENIERIGLRARPSVDRATGRLLLVPKPYFTQGDAGLELHNVPVPLERAEIAERPDHVSGDGLVYRFRRLYRRFGKLRELTGRSRVRHPEFWSFIYHASRFEPYPAYLSADTRGWKLMRALLDRFLEGAGGTPCLIVPIPEYRYLHYGIVPRYQGLYESVGRDRTNAHVLDVTRPMLDLPRRERRALTFRRDPHFSPAGHAFLADLIAGEVHRRGLLPGAHPAAAPPAPKAARSGYILGISCLYHNSAACLVLNGRIVATAEEERFTRVKNDRRFPHHAVNYCLEEAGIHQHDLDAVVYYDNASLTFERLMHTLAAVGDRGEEGWMRALPSWVKFKLHLPRLIRTSLMYDGPVLQEVHHRSHAASAFYPSPFEEAAILTIDGVGEWATASIGVGRGGRVELLKEMHFPHSLGLLYSAFTQFTGFKVNSGEYKMMGLSPYGRPRYVDTILEHLVDLKTDGSVELNMDYFGYLSEESMIGSRFAKLFGGPARRPEDRITRREMDIAKSVQVVTEEAILRMGRHAHELTGLDKLCLAGGVALNCVANGRLLREGPFTDLWIQPAAGDSGCAIGAALDAYHTFFGGPRTLPPDGRPLQRGSCWGPGFSGAEVRAFLETHGYAHHKLEPGERARVLAGYLAEGKVLGHFSGRMEVGPRALGNRSILGDARNPEMQVKLNLKIKYRESFRPFAPSVLAERAANFFEMTGESPYMLLVAPVKQGRRLPFELPEHEEDMLKVVRQPRSDVPAITHVDFSARVQTVMRDDNPEYYDLIKAFEEQTGYGVIVNTSFNVRGEPIVCTPYDAYRCFMRTDMDILALGDFVLLKHEQPAWPEPKGHVEEDLGPAPPPERGAFAAELRSIFHDEFLPVASRLASQDILGIDLTFRHGATMWVDADPNQSPPHIFKVPKALDNPTVDSELMAEELTGRWAHRPAAEELRPIVERLLRLGDQANESANTAFEEEVSDAIYVMY